MWASMKHCFGKRISVNIHSLDFPIRNSGSVDVISECTQKCALETLGIYNYRLWGPVTVICELGCFLWELLKLITKLKCDIWHIEEFISVVYLHLHIVAHDSEMHSAALQI